MKNTIIKLAVGLFVYLAICSFDLYFKYLIKDKYSYESVGEWIAAEAVAHSLLFVLIVICGFILARSLKGHAWLTLFVGILTPIVFVCLPFSNVSLKSPDLQRVIFANLNYYSWFFIVVPFATLVGLTLFYAVSEWSKRGPIG